MDVNMFYNNVKLIMVASLVFLFLLVTGCGQSIDPDKVMTAGSGAQHGPSADGLGQVYNYNVDIVNFNDDPIVIEEIEPVFSEIIASLQTRHKMNNTLPSTLFKEQTMKVSGEMYIYTTEEFSSEEIRKILVGIKVKVKGLESPIFLKTAH
jgi:ATP-dependent protease HslVU (ClpYQ) peptidase subunit